MNNLLKGISMANTRHVSNTLSRWHKVVERFKQAIAQLSVEINRGIGQVSYSNLAVLNAEHNVISRDADTAVSKVALLLALNMSLGRIRESLARANVEKGVSALLAEQVSKQSQKGLLEGLVAASGGSRLQLSDAAAVLAERPGMTSVYRESHSFSRVDEATVEGWQAQIDGISRELVALSDRISDANASRHAIELDEDVLAYMGM